MLNNGKFSINACNFVNLERKLAMLKSGFDMMVKFFTARWAKVSFIFVGLGSLVWFLARVIPKPSRAAYPCMKAAAPLASSFVLYLLSLTASITVYKKARTLIADANYITAAGLLLVSIAAGVFALTQSSPDTYADRNITYQFNDPLGPNSPIGEAKGIFPGRVVWVNNPAATDENCTNANLSDAFFLDKNSDQEVIDAMFSQGILALTGEATDGQAWDAIFKYFNVQHDKGDVGYNADETLFIKINAVSAWSGIGSDGKLRRLPHESDTTPQVICALIRQLVNVAGVTEENIYLGDPIAGVWNHIHNKIAAEFPNVQFMDVEGTVAGRTKLVASGETGVTYSDKGVVLNNDQRFPGKHHLYESMMNADYLINIPVMKGHRWAGVTLFAKNHFGSNTSGTSWQLHAGLMNNDNKGDIRTGYKKYRVLVDLMASQHLGGNTLLYLMDALWSTSYEHQLPQKFQSSPFNNDWSSSLLFSQDHVAIESVCIDILQKEFTAEDLSADPPRFTYVQWDGVDDYLHQAASSDWWPVGVSYDPDDSGTPIASLGVHEHWNNGDDMAYSRNLGTGEGIELIKLFEPLTGVKDVDNTVPGEFALHDNYPNPFNPATTIRFNLPEQGYTTLQIFDITGELVDVLINGNLQGGSHGYTWNSTGLASGTYIYRLTSGRFSVSKSMILLK
jgi:hypothetical protein